MKCQLVHAYKDRLDYLFDQASEFSDNPELLAHWANYLCVLVSGFVEVAMREIYYQYAKGRTDPSILNFVKRQLASVNNPKMKKVKEVTAWFSPDWAKQLESQLSDEHVAALNSIMDNRHNIAHGRSSDISYIELKKWYSRIIQLVDEIESLCGI